MRAETPSCLSRRSDLGICWSATGRMESYPQNPQVRIRGEPSEQFGRVAVRLHTGRVLGLSTTALCMSRPKMAAVGCRIRLP